MSDSIRLTVANILASAGVSFRCVYIGEKQSAFNGGLTMDEWRVFLSKETRQNPALPYVREEFEFFTGTGHRVDTPATKLARVQLKNVNRNSIAWHEMLAGMKPKAPNAADVLYSLILDSSACDESFNDWCGNCGYDTDSRKALETYLLCQENANKLRRVFPSKSIADLRDALQDY